MSVAVPTQALASGTRVGEYEITGKLGAGGMGTVYAGVHGLIGQRVAIKVLNPAMAANERIVERFIREARAVTRIQHRNIIDVYNFGHAPEIGHYLVMPLLDGQPLGDRIAQGGPMAPDAAISVVRQIASALDAAHGAGIYHRDLKPDNVFLVAEHDGPSVKILDFGIAKLIDGEVSTTQTGAQMGTPLFMSPEQWDGADVDGRTDVYALGILAHFLLTGRYPFEAGSPLALMNMHANAAPTPASEHGADRRADPVIATALAKNRGHRFTSAGAFARALSEALGAATAPTLAAVGTTASEIDALPVRRTGLWLALAAALAVLVAGGAVLWGLRGGDGAGAAEPEDPAADGREAIVPEPEAPEPTPSQPAPAPAAAPDAGLPDARTVRETKPKPRPEPKRTRDSKPKTDVKAPEPKPDHTKDDSEWGDTVDPF